MHLGSCPAVPSTAGLPKLLLYAIPWMASVKLTPKLKGTPKDAILPYLSQTTIPIMQMREASARYLQEIEALLHVYTPDGQLL
jgi:hypothetical protein